MITESNETTATEETTEQATELDINKLIDKPYSEMTEKEIEFVVEWKASIKARDTAYEAIIAEIQKQGHALVDAYTAQAEKDAARQDALLQASIERMNRLKGGSTSE